jgi:hypothetical protein
MQKVLIKDLKQKMTRVLANGRETGNLLETKHPAKRILSLRLVESFLAPVVVFASLVRVRQSFVGIVDLLKLFQCYFVAGVFVGMVLEGELAVCLFDFSCSCILL